jgi:hypothetical protein
MCSRVKHTSIIMDRRDVPDIIVLPPPPPDFLDMKNSDRKKFEVYFIPLYCKPTFIRQREILAQFTRTSLSWIFLAANQIYSSKAQKRKLFDKQEYNELKRIYLM